MILPQDDSNVKKFSDSETQARTINHDVPILKYALRYGELKRFPIPVHVPIIHPGGRVGCSCEDNKRSERYRQWLISKGRERDFDPGFECRTPGKHPIGSDWETKASNDPYHIRTAFRRRKTVDVDTGEPVYYYPNIGRACGPAGDLAVDLDTYKEEYAGEALLTREDEDTETNLTQSGGTHLIYDRQGLPYGNDTGDLPPGVDIRGVGGQILVAPSLGKTGNRYQWELGYEPGQIERKPIPEKLRAILDAAHRTKRSRAAVAVNFADAAGDAPDLSKWDMSDATIDKIHNPAERGHRSEHDAAVVTALCAAGLSDDDILAIFYHYPVGTAGKFAERGEDYLARTVGNARAYLAEQERKAEELRARLEAAREWGQVTRFADVEPSLLRPRTYKTGDGEPVTREVYLSDSTDTKVYDAALCEMIKRRSDTITLGGKRLAKLAGLGSHHTALKAINRLAFVLRSEKTEFGVRLTLRSDFSFRVDCPLSPPTTVVRGQSTRNEIITYSERKDSEPFLTGTSRAVKERCREASIVAGGTLKEWLATVERGLGETMLRCLAHAPDAGATVSELAEMVGKTKGSVYRALHRAESLGLMESSRETSRAPKVYSLAPDVWKQVDDLAPELRTAGLTAQREDDRLLAAQRWTAKQKDDAKVAGDAEAMERADKRLKKLGNQRLTVIGHRYPDLPKSDLAEMAFDYHEPAGLHPAAVHLAARKAEEDRQRVWKLTNEAISLRKKGLTRQAAVQWLQGAGYGESEAKAATHRVWNLRKSKLDSESPQEPMSKPPTLVAPAGPAPSPLEPFDWRNAPLPTFGGKEGAGAAARAAIAASEQKRLGRPL